MRILLFSLIHYVVLLSPRKKNTLCHRSAILYTKMIDSIYQRTYKKAAIYKIKHLLIVYFLRNFYQNNYQNWFVYVKVIVHLRRF